MQKNISFGKKRVVIENLKPEIDCGNMPIKRTVMDTVKISANIFADSHYQISARLMYKHSKDQNWETACMKALPNDIWSGSFQVKNIGIYHYKIQAWIDHFATWCQEVQKKLDSGEDVSSEILQGVQMLEGTAERLDPGQDKDRLLQTAEKLKKEPELDQDLFSDKELIQIINKYPDPEIITEYPKELELVVDRKKARHSTWYEFFPRSFSEEKGRHGTFQECRRIIPEIAEMGFDVVYLPPIHPIGQSNKKGKNNSPNALPTEPGSPWAIGSELGGHKSIHPELGEWSDFYEFKQDLEDYGLELALDLAFQCSMDHPYLREHPEWFSWRPDGTVQFAENPPKKYQDIVPFDFESHNWPQLWEELKSIVDFWIEQGVKIFRVDNPHTKPFAFWEWLIREIKSSHPEVIFLSEAFTRPKVMQRLAKLGFSQSYTYFAWRNSKHELIEYMRQLTQSELAEYFQPNFWPNTPDILPDFLQYSGRPGFIIRLVLAATLASNYGIYGPPFELCISQAVEGKEEYLNSEKYELKNWLQHWDRPGNLKDLIASVNKIRKENPALQYTQNLNFLQCDNENILAFNKISPDKQNNLLIVISLDPFQVQKAKIRLPVSLLGLDPTQPYMLHDLLGQERHIWTGELNDLELNPHVMPAKIFKIRSKIHSESDFDYYI